MDLLEHLFPFIEWLDHGNGTIEAALIGGLAAAVAAIAGRWARRL